MAGNGQAGAGGNPTTVAELEAALARRFGADHPIVASADAAVALGALGQAAGRVALLLAGQRLMGMPGIEFLCQAHGLHPAARWLLMLGDRDDGMAEKGGHCLARYSSQ